MFAHHRSTVGQALEGDQRVAQLLLLGAMGATKHDSRTVPDAYVVLFEALSFGFEIALSIVWTRVRLLRIFC